MLSLIGVVIAASYRDGNNPIAGFVPAIQADLLHRFRTQTTKKRQQFKIKIGCTSIRRPQLVQQVVLAVRLIEKQFSDRMNQTFNIPRFR